MVLSEEQFQRQRSKISSDHVCRSCSSVKLLYLGRNKELNEKEYQCPKCGKRYRPKPKVNVTLEAASQPKPKRERKSTKTKSKPKVKSSYDAYNYNYLLEYHERERQERRAEFLKENDYYNNIIGSELKTFDDEQKRKRVDESGSSLIMSQKGRRHNTGRMTKYMRDRL